jgi:hypothetical protein
MDNAFLRSFLKARETMTSEKKKSADTDKVIVGEEKKGGITMMTIIEDCPPKSKVLEYFRKRIEELEADDD